MCSTLLPDNYLCQQVYMTPLLSSSSSHDQCPVSRHRSHPRFAPFVGHLVRALVVATVLPRVLVFPLTESQPWSHHLLCRRTMYALLLPLERVDSVFFGPPGIGDGSDSESDGDEC